MIDEHRITFMSSVPAIWKLALKLAKAPKGRSLQRVHCGSAPLSAAMWEEIRKWTGTRDVSNTYGITETGSWVAGLEDASVAAEDGLIGEGWGAVIQILHTDDPTQSPGPEQRCATGESGYVWINTPALMKGYFRRDVCQSRRGRLVHDRRYRLPRRPPPAAAPRPGARRNQQGRDEDLPFGHRCSGRAIRPGQ
jgi:acyl-CoA synthetase (AMP-forming)/AMP-acid ligase II